MAPTETSIISNTSEQLPRWRCKRVALEHERGAVAAEPKRGLGQPHQLVWKGYPLAPSQVGSPKARAQVWLHTCEPKRECSHTSWCPSAAPPG